MPVGMGGFPGMGAGGQPPMLRPPGGNQQEGGPRPTNPLKQALGILDSEEAWVETKTPEGKSYFYHAITRQTVWEKPTDPNIKIFTQQEVEAAVQKHQQQKQAVPPVTNNNQPGNTNFRFPGMPGGGGGFPFFNMPPPNMFMNMMQAGGAGQTAPPGDPAAIWQEFSAQDGRKYYYNAVTQETTWDKPQVLKDLASKRAANGDKESNENEGGAQQPQEARPVSSNPVAGTPWCVVWTADHKVFFFNPSTRTSVWELPPELYGRPDVDLLVSKPPEPKKTKPGEIPMGDGTAAPFLATQISVSSDMEPPKKKKKKEKKEARKARELAEKEKEKQEKEEPKEKANQPDPAVEAELKAARERAEVPLEVRLQR